MTVAIRRLLVPCAAAFLAFAAAVHAQPATEPAVKAAFVFKFLGYVEWPAAVSTPEGPYVIGIAGAEEVAAELERMAAPRTINGRRVAVRRVRDAEGARGVHVLFVGQSAPNGRELLRAVGRQGVLSVTDMEHGLEAGSVVNLVTVEDHIGFEVSLDAAERGGLAISSRMLAVARRVVPRGPS